MTALREHIQDLMADARPRTVSDVLGKMSERHKLDVPEGLAETILRDLTGDGVLRVEERDRIKVWYVPDGEEKPAGAV